MKNVNLTIKEIQVYSTGENAGDGVVVTEKSDSNPSESGVFKQTAKQLQRLADKCGAPNITSLKLLVQLGGSKFNMDTQAVKAGDTYELADGESGTYNSDFIKTDNEAIKLGEKAVNTLLAISMRQATEAGGDLPM